MATEVILPRVDMDMAEGQIALWYVKDGETVRKGQVLFEIETDKATMEVDAPVAGVMHGIHGEVGVKMPVGQVVGWILAPGEAAPQAAVIAAVTAASSAAADDAGEAAAAASAARHDVSAATAVETATVAVGTAAARQLLRATPLARSLAREHGVDLALIAGSGPDGRVLGDDVTSALAAKRADMGSGAAVQRDPNGLHLRWARRAGGSGKGGIRDSDGNDGSNTPLLLIHGFGADQGSWRALLQHLPETQPVVAIDLPNHGKSPAQAVHSLQDVARLVLARLDDEGIAACHVLGHSLGGGVALALAQAAPQRVRSLTLLAPAGLGPDINADFIDGLVRADDEAALKTAMTALFHDPAGLTGSFVATAFQQLQSPERRQALAGMAQQLMPHGRQSQSLREVLAGLRVPVQVIWGIGDRIIPMRHALDAPPQVAVHLLPAVGHLPHVEAPAWVAGLLRLHPRVAPAG